jgi:hypothetical protein
MFDPVIALPTDVEIVKGRAYQTIVERYPGWKQWNMHSRATELLYQLMTKGALTPEEQSEFEDIKAAWAWINEIRAQSDAEEAALPPPEQVRD